MAVVGKGFAVLQSGRIHLRGLLAWLAWAGIHIQFLANTNLKLSVLVQWLWTFLTGQRGSRLIVNHHRTEPAGASEPAATPSRPAPAEGQLGAVR